MADYRFDDVTDPSAWDAFVRASPQGTLFCLEAFLETLPFGAERRWVRRGRETVGALCVDRTEHPRHLGDRAQIYNGVLFAESVSGDTPRHRSRRFAVAEAAAAWLDAHYDRVTMRLSPHVDDVRPFSWHNYHAPPEAPRFVVDVQYTSYLDLGVFGDAGRSGPSPAFLEGLHPLRRRTWRQGAVAEARTVERLAPGLLVDGYRELMAEQGQPVEAEALGRLAARIEALVVAGHAAQFVTEADGHPVYTAVFGWDDRRAYYLYGAPVGPSTPYQGTACFMGAFEALVGRGTREVDLEGVNSPRRGWFKLSFGGDLRPLFLIRKAASGPSPLSP